MSYLKVCRMKLLVLLRNPKIQEFIRFCIVGVFATLVHYGIYLALLKIWQTNLELLVNIYYSIGYAVGFVCNLFLSAHFTFKTKVTIRKSLGFACTNVVNYVLHLIFLNLFLWIGVNEQWAPIPTFCCVIPINFILVRTVFKKIK